MKYNSRVVAGVASTALLFTAACGNSPENAKSESITALSVVAASDGASVDTVPHVAGSATSPTTTAPHEVVDGNPEADAEPSAPTVVPVVNTSVDPSPWTAPDTFGLTDMQRVELAWTGVANDVFRKADAPMRQDVLNFYLSDPYKRDAAFFYSDLSRYEVEVDFQYRFDRVETQAADLVEIRVCVWSRSVTRNGDLVIDAGNPEPLFNLAKFEPQSDGRWTMFWYGGWSPRQVDVELGVDHYRRCEL